MDGAIPRFKCGKSVNSCGLACRLILLPMKV